MPTVIADIKDLPRFKDIADNPNDEKVVKLISEIDFYSKHFNIPEELLNALVCNAYYLGKMSFLSHAKRKIIEKEGEGS